MTDTALYCTVGKLVVIVSLLVKLRVKLHANMRTRTPLLEFVVSNNGPYQNPPPASQLTCESRTATAPVPLAIVTANSKVLWLPVVEMQLPPMQLVPLPGTQLMDVLLLLDWLVHTVPTTVMVLAGLIRAVASSATASQPIHRRMDFPSGSPSVAQLRYSSCSRTS